jgi:hypothetical protein
MKKSEEQIPRGLKPARNDKNKRTYRHPSARCVRSRQARSRTPPEFQTLDEAFSKRSESEQVARIGIELIHRS